MRWFSRKSPRVAEEIQVLRTDARVGDAPALKQLLESLPEAEELNSQLQGKFFARAWDKNSNRDYWVSSDGAQASCFTLCGLNLKQAAAVRVRWDAHANQLVLSERALAEVVAAETGATVQVIAFVKR